MSTSLSTFDPQSDCCGPNCVLCGPCYIPGSTLAFEWTAVGAGGTPSLTYHPASSSWSSGPISYDVGRLTFTLTCDSGRFRLEVLREDQDPDTGVWTVTYDEFTYPTTSSCLPFDFLYALRSIVDPVLWADGLRGFEITSDVVCPEVCIPCGTCCVPHSDFILSGTNFFGPFSTRMFFSGPPFAWISDRVPFGAGFSIQYGYICQPPEFAGPTIGYQIFPGGFIGDRGDFGPPTAQICDPYHVEWGPDLFLDPA